MAVEPISMNVAVLSFVSWVNLSGMEVFDMSLWISLIGIPKSDPEALSNEKFVRLVILTACFLGSAGLSMGVSLTTVTGFRIISTSDSETLSNEKLPKLVNLAFSFGSSSRSADGF